MAAYTLVFISLKQPKTEADAKGACAANGGIGGIGICCCHGTGISQNIRAINGNEYGLEDRLAGGTILFDKEDNEFFTAWD